MGYFNNFEIVNYNGRDTVNIMNSVLTRYKPIRKTELFYYHTVRDGETPETISYDEYGTTEFWWIILAVNKIVDPFHDWLMSSYMLDKHLHSIYGDSLDGIHHYQDLISEKRCDGYDSDKYQALLDAGEPIPHDIKPVSNEEYAVELNEEKRKVKIIAPEYIQDIQDNFEEIMDERSSYRDNN